MDSCYSCICMLHIHHQTWLIFLVNMLSASPTAPDMSIRSSRYHENTVYQYISAYYKYIQGEGGRCIYIDRCIADNKRSRHKCIEPALTSSHARSTCFDFCTRRNNDLQMTHRYELWTHNTNVFFSEMECRCGYFE